MRVAVCLLLLLITRTSSPGQSIDSTLSRYYKALGGWNNLSAITSVRGESMTWVDGSALNRNMPTFGEQVKPKRMVFVRKSPVFEHCEIFGPSNSLETVSYANGKRNGNLFYGPEFPLGRYVESLFHDRSITVHLAFILDQGNRAHKLKFVGERVVGDQAFSVVKGPYPLTLTESLECLFYFEVSSGLLTRYEVLGDSPQTVELSDYRLVGSVRAPFLQVNKRNGIMFNREEITSLSWNPSIEDSIFFYTDK